jgi:chemotaxis protein methyltransferase CheR
MTRAPDDEDVERFRLVVARRLGLAFDDSRRTVLAEVLDRRLSATRVPLDRYLADLDGGAPGDDADAVATQLTVGETYFLRNGDQFRAFGDAVIPDVVRAQASRRRLRILSAGCASGEEAYSVAMLTRDLVDAGWEVDIRAVDVNPEMIAKARRGRFSTWAMRETPPETRRQWFRAEGREHVLDARIRDAVRFQQGNLVAEAPDLWAPARYDVVFCRNVLMYLTPEATRTVVGRITRSLVPGGYLFLGHAETLRGLSQDFHLCHTHGAFYYQRLGRPAVPSGSTTPGTTDTHETRDGPSSIVAVVDAADSWVDAIRLATERVQQLAAAPLVGVGAAAAARAPERAERSDLGLARRLLSEERYGDALDAVTALPPRAADDPDVLLLHGVLLVHTGRLEAAEETCRRLLAIDDLHAGAHYVLALCREAAGDRRGAVEHDRMAAYLDPSFAMPRLHLGLLARRAGQREEARQELRQVVTLLQGEDASRVLLFGGGFSREALVTLAQGELLAVSDAP